MNAKARCAVAAFCIFAFAGIPVLAAAGPAQLRVDNLVNPLGIDDPAPSFSWQLNDPARGAKQTAYQVDVFAGEA